MSFDRHQSLSHSSRYSGEDDEDEHSDSNDNNAADHFLDGNDDERRGDRKVGRTVPGVASTKDSSGVSQLTMRSRRFSKHRQQRGKASASASSSTPPPSLRRQKEALPSNTYGSANVSRNDGFFSSSSSSDNDEDENNSDDTSLEDDNSPRRRDNSKHQQQQQASDGGNNDSTTFTSIQHRQDQLQKKHQQQQQQQHQIPLQYEQTGDDIDDDPLSSGVLPDVLMTMRQKIESLTLFDSDMMKLANGGHHPNHSNSTGMIEDPISQETRESLKRSSQQSISAAVLVSLAHKRYERRRLAAMEIEKVVRSLVQQSDEQLERVRAILLLLSDDYVRSTSEDARKGGVVALAASAIGLKKAPDTNIIAHECRDLILASVVHACQDHSQRVRYYATESLFNVIKVIPSLAVQHFFILFEILRSLYADVDVDVKSGAELLDKKLKEVIVVAMNSGQFTAEACVPVFARFVYMRNKATKRLTLTWLQELTEKLIGAPILEFLHLFLTGIFDMIADPTLAIRQSALAFLQSVLPKLLDNHVVEEAIDDFQTAGIKVDFDKILQSLVTTMEHPDPFVRKIAMYWMSRIVKAHIGGEKNRNDIGNDNSVMKKNKEQADEDVFHGLDDETEHQINKDGEVMVNLSAATMSVRNSLPHVLPGILLSIGDTFHSKSNVRDYFLPDTTTHTLAEQTNACLQNAVRKDGKAYVQHLDSFIVALREELDSPGGVNARNPPAIERRPYRMDVKHDGTGIESQGWFRASNDTKEANVDSMMMSRLCALHWIIVLYESVVPDVLKADYAREFIIPIIHQLVDNPPEKIIFKSLEVLAAITIPVKGESQNQRLSTSNSLSGLTISPPSWVAPEFISNDDDQDLSYPMNDNSVGFALEILDKSRRPLQSRDREVFSALIQLYGYNLHLIGDLSRVIAYMCRLQPPEFVFVSFAVELDHFVRRERQSQNREDISHHPMSQDYQFVSAFIQQMCLVLLNSKEANELRNILKDCIGYGREIEERDRRRSRLFHVLLHSFSHNLVATTSLCLWGGACRTASLFLKKIDPLDISLVFLLELDKLVEMIERPLFRHLHVRMLETDKNPLAEGSGTMLFQTLKSILMLLPQSACYNVLRDRLVSTSRFRQSVIANNSHDDEKNQSKDTEVFVSRVLTVRKVHCKTVWEKIRAESLESIPSRGKFSEIKDDGDSIREEGDDRRKWLGYNSKEEDSEAKAKYNQERQNLLGSDGVTIEVEGTYNEFISLPSEGIKTFVPNTGLNIIAKERVATPNVASGEDAAESKDEEETWKRYWSTADTNA